MARKTLRAPEGYAETRALTAWHNGLPVTSMRILDERGYTYAERLSFLIEVAGCKEDADYYACMSVNFPPE